MLQSIKKQLYNPSNAFFKLVSPVYLKNRDKLKYQIFYYHNRLNALTKGKVLTTRIRNFNIEFTSKCNLDCKWCILNREKDGYMSEEFLDRLLIQLTKNPKIKIDNIALHHGGDALMHPRFENLINIISERKKGVKTFPKVNMITNATLLTENRTKEILDAGAIDWIRFSVDGGSKKEYEKIRKNAKWENVLKNINYFIEQNKKSGKKIKTSIMTLVDPDYKLSDEFKELISKVDEYVQRYPHNWEGSEDIDEEGMELGLKGKQVLPKKSFCDLIFTNIVVLWDGRVVPCCIDLNARGVLGDLNKEKFLNIYHGNKRQFMLKKMKKNKRHEIQLCEKCGVMFG